MLSALIRKYFSRHQSRELHPQTFVALSDNQFFYSLLHFKKNPCLHKSCVSKPEVKQTLTQRLVETMLYTKLALRAYYDRISFSLKKKLSARLKYLMTYMQLDTKEFSINTPTAYIICSIYSIPVFPYVESRIHLWHLISRKIHTTFISIF